MSFVSNNKDKKEIKVKPLERSIKKRKKKSITNNTEIKLEGDYKLKNDKEHGWYISLVSVKERQPLSNFFSDGDLDKRCANKTNRTRIYTTMNPQGLLDLLKLNKTQNRIPSPLIPIVKSLGALVEKIPIMKEIAGSVIIYGEKPKA